MSHKDSNLKYLKILNENLYKKLWEILGMPKIGIKIRKSVVFVKKTRGSVLILCRVKMKVLGWFGIFGY